MSETVERRVHGLTIQIDRTLCVGFGDCITEVDGAFVLDEEGIAAFAVPDTVSRDDLLRACEACPVDAILVRNVEGAQLVP